jgi:hypothetical protein
LTSPEKNVVPSPSKAIKVKDQRRLNISAMNPMMGGPMRKPINPILETVANATEGDKLADLPALL